MMRPTASKLALLDHCAYWARPDAVWSDRETDEASLGRRFHAAIATYARTRKYGLVDDDIARMYTHACAWIDSLNVKVDALIIERSFAWDPETDTAEAIGYDRDYTKADGRLCGTADLILVVKVDGKAISAMVWDWKSGIWSGHGSQLRTLGLMVARALRIENVTVAALDVSDDGIVESEREELDSFELQAQAGEVCEQLALIDGAEPQPGAHCGEEFCPAKTTCPAGASALAQVIPSEALTAPRRYSLADPIETGEHAAWALNVMRLVSAKLEAIKDDLKAKLPPEGWTLDDGSVLREGSCTSKGFSKENAIALCKQLGATDQQLEDLTYSYQKSTGLRVVGGPKKTRARKPKAA